MASDSVKTRMEAGRARRKATPLRAHAEWSPPGDRREPLGLIERSKKERLPEYIPIRYGRMLESPLAYLRGSSVVMASDLAYTPSSGILVQLCGDAHLANFGFFATPERNLVFGINDFDETLPGPFEWDLKRLATSIVTAGNFLKHTKQQTRRAVLSCLEAYSSHMQRFARQNYLQTWYSQIDEADLLRFTPDDREALMEQHIQEAHATTHHRAMEKLTIRIGKGFRLEDDPPLLVHRPILSDSRPIQDAIQSFLLSYRSSLNEDRRILLERYKVVDVALKVVGVGSVGKRCFLALLRGASDQDPLFLQVKEATPSALEPYLGASQVDHAGKRIVQGQRLLQAASDLFLGWGSDADLHFYVRQYRDLRSAVDFSQGRIKPKEFTAYTALCSWALALAHARSGDPALIAGYIGQGEQFEQAILDFSEIYAKQTEGDYRVLLDAASSGRIIAALEE